MAVLAAPACAETINDIPEWLPRGILQIETGSYYKANGLVHYAQKTGKDYGPFQLSTQSWGRLRAQKLIGGSSALDALNRDMRQADKTARLLMLDLYQNEAKQDWFTVASMWRLGPTGARQKPAQARSRANAIKAVGVRMVSKGPQ